MAQAPSQNQSAPSHHGEGKDLSKAAVAWTVVLIAGVSFAAASAFKDHQNLAVIEKAVERTAVGDKNWFPADAAPLPSLVFEGGPLIPAGKQSETMSEPRMRIAGVTESGNYRLYVPQERAGENAETGGPSWSVKTGPGQFLRVTR
jgi:hypothetical protein